MRPKSTSLHFWLSRRIRVACICILLISLFIPPYISEGSAAVPDNVTDQPQQYMLAEDGFLMKTSPLTEQGTRSAFTQGIIHTVESKESIASIAKLYDLKEDTIRNANNLDATAKLTPGQTLLILPVDGLIHTVKRGQNLSTIAELYGVSSAQIAAQNKIRNGYLLAGQELIIPGGKPLIVVAKSSSSTAKIGTKSPATVKVAQVPADNGSVKPPYEIDVTKGILQWPCDCFMTQGYSAVHFGVDLQHRGGGPIFAAEDGTVIRADNGWNGGYGNVIEIDNGNGRVTLYGHNRVLRVKVGDTVKRAQYIADMGNTGLVHGPTGIHVHFEVHVNGVKRNPMLYLQE